MQDYFHRLASLLDGLLRGREQYKCWLAGEASDFVRFNRSAIRQAGHVRQFHLTLSLLDGLRHAKSTMTLSGRIEDDHPLLERTLSSLRAQLADLPEDPHLLIATQVQSSEHVAASCLPDSSAMIDEVLAAAQGHDLVGIFAAGPVYHGFANSLGQRNWHEKASFHLDWSLYGNGDKAVKSAYAGREWKGDEFRARLALAAERLALMKRDPISIAPGAYRAYLAPAALHEILGMLNWGGVSEKALRTRQSPLRRMREEGVQLHRAVSLTEAAAAGLAPAFQEDGFIKPDRVALFEQGRLAGSLVSPRTAKEYGIETNGADADEAMASLDLAPGDLPMAQALAALDTGIFIGNLWYANFSDRANCCLTGMTRFATFWVEKGEIKAPLNVMRFDDSLFRLLGDKLEGLTCERELLIGSESYGARCTRSALLPGALVSEFRFVL